jgi:FkbH-like protein
MSSGSEIRHRQEIERLFSVTANFTAEPIADILRFWIEILSFGPAKVTFSGYNQVFQELVLTNGLLASSSPGVNFLLIRIEDWARDQKEDLRLVSIENAGQEFIATLKAFALRAQRPTILLLCPPSQYVASHEFMSHAVRILTDEICRVAIALRGVSVITAETLAAFYPVEHIDDSESNREGHIPFTRSFWVAAGTMIMRQARTLLRVPRKVIAVDADNTLWGGVVAEVGADKVLIDGEWAELQKFLKQQKDCGMLLALSSKNQEKDVEEVFRRPGMVLRRSDFVDWKVNWKRKSENLRALAADLNLALDSFIFLDDNPMECAEVASHCPSITVLAVPTEIKKIPLFLRHAWIFDLPSTTSEDKNRTEQYRVQADRKQLQSSVGSYREFIEKLELKVDMTQPTPDQFERAAQLTQRTNQFNATNVRRTSSELGSLIASGSRQALLVRVQDRFGDYGDVGLGVYWFSANDLNVENFLLSCRVLGKGVEHRLLSQLGRIASQSGKTIVVIPFKRTERNEPAARFFHSVCGDFLDGDLYRIPAVYASSVIFDPEYSFEASPESVGELPANEGSTRIECNFDEIARRLTSVPEIQRAIKSRFARSRPPLDIQYIAPRNTFENKLADIWEDVLGLDCVGIQDNFFDLGGDSVLSIQIVTRANEFGFRFNVRQFFESPSIIELSTLFRNEVSSTEVALHERATTPPEFSLSKLSQKSLNHVLEYLAKGRK